MVIHSAEVTGLEGLEFNRGRAATTTSGQNAITEKNLVVVNVQMAKSSTAVTFTIIGLETILFETLLKMYHMTSKVYLAYIFH